MKKFLILVFVLILVSSVYAACPTTAGRHGISIEGVCYDCGVSDSVCPNNFGVDCSANPDPDCAPMPVIGEECLFNSAAWVKDTSGNPISQNTVIESTKVYLKVETSGCKGVTLNFKVYEDDWSSSDNVNTNPNSIVVGDNAIVYGEWTAEYQDDFSGGPEYYFEVSGYESILSSTEEADELKVTKFVPIIGGPCTVGASCTTSDNCPGAYDNDCACKDIDNDGCPKSTCTNVGNSCITSDNCPGKFNNNCACADIDNDGCPMSKGACTSCDKCGWFDVWGINLGCGTEGECSSCGDCYFYNGIIFNSCTSCSAMSCENYDSTRCSTDSCNIGPCEWVNNECVKKITPKPTCGSGYEFCDVICVLTGTCNANCDYSNCDTVCAVSGTVECTPAPAGCGNAVKCSLIQKPSCPDGYSWDTTNNECKEKQVVITYSQCTIDNKCVQASGEGDSDCSADADCTGTKHKECSSGNCIDIDGGGKDQCGNGNLCGDIPDEQHTECSAVGSCVLVDKKGDNLCALGSTCSQKQSKICAISNGQLECLTLSGMGWDLCEEGDCINTKTHTECNADSKCVQVLGEGPNECDLSMACLKETSHKECSNEQCIAISGDSVDLCSSDSCGDIPDEQHTECSAVGSCVLVYGAGTDKCGDDSDCDNPNPKICAISNGQLECLTLSGMGWDLCDNECEECTSVTSCGYYETKGACNSNSCDIVGDCMWDGEECTEIECPSDFSYYCSELDICVESENECYTFSDECTDTYGDNGDCESQCAVNGECISTADQTTCPPIGCASYETPATTTEEPSQFPIFTWFNLIITCLILIGFYTFYRKK